MKKKNYPMKKYVAVYFLLLARVAIQSQSTVYIDPQYTGIKKGTINQPFNSWKDITWKSGYTYLFKCGTISYVNYDLRPEVGNITIGAYGTGNRPYFRSSVTDKVLDLMGFSDVTVKDIELESTNNAVACISFLFSNRCKVINCRLSGSQWGIRNLSAKGLFQVLNSEVFKTGDDGIYIQDVDSVELGNSIIRDVNRKYFTSTLESYAGGDGVQLTNVKSFNIHDNTIDHSSTGNKACLMSSNSNGSISHGRIIKNHFIRNQTGNLLYLDKSENILIQSNRFESAEYAIFNYSKSPVIFGNEFINITNTAIALGGPAGSSTNILNNTFYNFKYLSNSYKEPVVIKNNVFFSCYGRLFSYNTIPNADYNCYFQISVMGEANAGSHSIKSDPMFVDAVNYNFSLKASSPCIDKGINLVGLILSSVFGSSVDIGAHEFSGNNSTVTKVSGATFYQNCNFTGTSITLPPGNYTTSDMAARGLGKDVVSSVNTGGYQVLLYKSDNFTDTPLTLNSSDNCLITDGWNDQTSSIKIMVLSSQNTGSPNVTITSPFNGINLSAPATVKITSTAASPNGSIQKVEFFSNGIKIGTSISAPFSFTWNNVPLGQYQITAIATDNLNLQSTSNKVTVWVVANTKSAKVDTDLNNSVNQKETSAFSISPDPSDGYVTIEFQNSSELNDRRIIVSDLSGKIQESFKISAGETSRNIDLSYLKSGMYLVIFQSKNFSVKQKIVKY